jgi:hypothetical protein
VTTVRIPVTGSPEPALIDHWNYRLVERSTWCLSADGYAVARINYRLFKMHRLIVGDPDDITVDHADRNRLNNTEANLRLATKRQQLQNSGQRRSSSPYKGVSYVRTAQKRRKRWVAQISVPSSTCGPGRLWRIGYFETPEEAAEAYDAAAIEHFGHFACTNVMLGLL